METATQEGTSTLVSQFGGFLVFLYFLLAFVVLELEDAHFVVVVSRAVLCDTLEIRNSILTELQAEEEPKNDRP